MSVVRLLEESARSSGGSATPRLGPAEVLEPAAGVDPRRAVDVRIDGVRTVRATMAMQLPYEPCAGDTVLTIGTDEATYVIGVIHGRGRTIVEMHGDVDLRALGGTLSLSSDRAVRVESPDVEIVARRLRSVAESVFQTASTMRQRVAELFSVHAGQVHTVADGASVSQAKSTTLLSEEKVTINGKSVHLG